MNYKILCSLILFYSNIEVILTQKDVVKGDEPTNERSWLWSVGKMKGRTWSWEQDGGQWIAWRWSMRGRSGSGFFFSLDSEIGPYVEAIADRSQRSLQWTWHPGKINQLSAACAVGLFNYTGKSGLISLDVDGYTLRSTRKTKSSSNICSLKPAEKESGASDKNSTEWVVDGRKVCKTVTTGKTADIDEFLIYVVLATHPSSIPSGLRGSRRRDRREAEEGAGEGVTEGAAEWVTTAAPPTTTTEEDEEDYDDEPEPSIFDSIIDMLMSLIGKLISFFM